LAKPAVLIVEPNERTRRMLSRGFRREGWRVAEASRREQALQALSDETVSLVVTGGDLEGNGGLALRDRAGGPAPWVVVTERRDVGMQSLARTEGLEVVSTPAFVKDLVVVAQIRAAEAEGRIFTADLGELRPFYLLRALLAGSGRGRIVVGHGEGEVHFDAGAVVAARFRGRDGKEAVFRVLTLRGGAAEVELGTTPAQITHHLDSRWLLGQGAAYLRAWEEAQAGFYPLDAVLQIDYGSLSSGFGELPEEALEMIRLFDGERTVDEIVDLSPLDPLAALRLATRLEHEHALLVPAPRRAITPVPFERPLGPARPPPPPRDAVAPIGPARPRPHTPARPVQARRPSRGLGLRALGWLFVFGLAAGLLLGFLGR
jgi:CheY-like chemotaxis protein